jgi:CRP-like cAMP-binding protein
MPVAIDLLKQFPFFQGLSEDLIAELSKTAQIGVVKEQQEIVSRGKKINFLSFVLSGKLQSTELADDGRIIATTIIIPGDVIGCLTLADNQPTTNKIVTLTPAQLLLIPMDQARTLVETVPIMAARIMALLAHALRQTVQEKSMLGLPNAYHRIYVQLNLLANNGIALRQITHIPRQQDIAAMANTSRETVSRALQTLIKNGILKKDGHQLEITRGDILNRLAQEGPELLNTLK